MLAEYDHEPEKQIALSLMARCGLRSDEAIDVRPMDVHRGDESDRWFVRVPDGKGEKERQTPCPADLAGMIRAQPIDQHEPVVGKATRTLRRWVTRAAQTRQAEEGDERWKFLAPHDLRRTWGHLCLEAGVQASVLMQWGGWTDYTTFQKHYLGKHSEETQAREADKVGWL